MIFESFESRIAKTKALTLFSAATSSVHPYCEWYYNAEGADLGFDPEFPLTLNDRARIRTWNALHALNLTNCDVGISPTRWQWSQHPEVFRSKIVVQHEGIDTENLGPDPRAQIVTPNGTVLKAGDPVVTYVARNLEPYRGLAFGAKTPCSRSGGPLISRSEVTRTPNLMRCSRGRGTRAAGRCMNSSGLMTKYVVASRHGVLAPVLAPAWAMKLAACCCTRRAIRQRRRRPQHRGAVQPHDAVVYRIGGSEVIAAAKAAAATAGKRVVPTATGATTGAQNGFDRGNMKHCHDKASDAKAARGVGSARHRPTP